MDESTMTNKASAPDPWGRNVLVEFEDGIAWVSMNRPEKKNAINVELAKEMAAVVDALEIDDRCGVMVLTGAGDAFSAGMDLKGYFQATDNLSEVERMRAYRINGTWQWRRLLHYPKPTIAMVNGWCFGGAFTPLCACDLAIAAEEATFGLSEINWGIIPAGIVSKAVAVLVRQREALYYVMTGETFNGTKAASMGLVNEAVPKARLRERTRELAKTLLTKNPSALRTAKVAFKMSSEMTWEQAADYLGAKSDQLQFVDPERGRVQGMKQFLDDKTYRPGLGAYRRPKDK
ncbi:MAG: p-hydroxycinnamoyl CoA hydratase/lyase [Betaproteobacteria bacterium RBG_16_64_18]|nr:MAG: p-hydroxycinnamoyl CoA hydratase/lyase [Betaproteobacteria bacterium RBG_16_64_18]OGA10554.1 MAG: p-hydroxycinnamoyl CoA hydratase/lyase [Betaproteobacteria bacterium RIFCSPLOWO2_02_FULL_65_20]OGA37337.1 MAG: p-hydroxycinnamoyl CoA hydratase/lyase [Betaproteobacteria bacterium RIFCSPLOWO2_12_FULL_65_110]